MYEHKTERIFSEMVDGFLNTQAKDGWECFGIYPALDDYFMLIVHLRRKIEQKNTPE